MPNSNPSTLIETSQQRVAFSNNRVQPQRARRRSGGVSDLRRSNLMTIDELGSNHNENNNSAGGRTQNIQLQVEHRIRRMSRGSFDLSRGFSDLSRGVSDLSRGVSDLSTIGEESNTNQNNNSAGGRTQNLGMHTIVEEDIRRLRGNGNDLLEPIPGWQNPAVVRETTQSTQPQEDVHVIPIENNTDTVRTSNRTNSTKCCNLRTKQLCYIIGIYVLTVVLLIVVGIRAYKRNQVEVSISTNDSSSSNDSWDDYDSHYDIAPQKVR